MKIVCEVCRFEGYLQHIGPNYYRVRHYTGVENGKPKFEYHKQSLEHVQRFLNQKPSPIDLIDLETIDPRIRDLSSFECEGWDSNPRRPSPEDLKSSPLS